MKQLFDSMVKRINVFGSALKRHVRDDDAKEAEKLWEELIEILGKLQSMI